MAPEAVGAAQADPRSDVWALGVVLHEMLTGARPAMPPSGAPIELPGDGADPRRADLEQLLGRMLAVDPQARPSDAASLVAELEAMRTTSGPRGRKARQVVALSALSVVAAGLAAFALLRSPAPPPFPPAPPGTRGHVLWVDDDPELSQAEESALERGGFEVSRARSTDEALTTFDPGVHQAVVTDLGRFEQGGYQPEAGLALLRGLRGREPDVRVVFFTSGRALEVILASPEGATAFGATDSTDEFYRLVAEAAEGARRRP